MADSVARISFALERLTARFFIIPVSVREAVSPATWLKVCHASPGQRVDA